MASFIIPEKPASDYRLAMFHAWLPSDQICWPTAQVVLVESILFLMQVHVRALLFQDVPMPEYNTQ